MPTLKSTGRRFKDVLEKQGEQAIRNFYLEGELVEVENGNGATSVNVLDENGAKLFNRMWCQLKGETNPTQVWAWGVAPYPGLPVWVYDVGQGYEIFRPKSLEGTNLYSEALYSVAMGAVFNEVNKFTIVDRNYQPGMVIKSPQGGLWVQCYAVRYLRKDGTAATLMPQEIDLTAYLPATANTWAWVIVCIDPVTNALTAVTGDEYAAPTLLTRDLLDDIDTAGLIPLDALKLEDSSTEITAENEFAFGRVLLQHRPKNNYNATTAPTVSNDNTQGYEVGSVWIDTVTGTVYFCSDASTGAAVWNSGSTPTLYYQTVAENGIDENQRGTLNFIDGIGTTPVLTDDSANDETEVQVDLDIDALTADGSPDGATDYVATWDASAGTHKKVLLNNLPGGGGGGGGTLSKTTQTLYTRTVLYEDTLASAGTWDVSSISQDYDTLEVELYLRTSEAVTEDIVYITLNNDTTDTNYRFGLHAGGSVNTSQVGDNRRITGTPGASATANYFGWSRIIIPDYTNTTRDKIVHSLSSLRTAAATILTQEHAFQWENTAAINRIAIAPNGAPTHTFDAGSTIRIIGVKETDVVTDVSGGLQGAAYSTDNVSSPPTDAEIDTAFGTPATVGAGYAGVINDNNAGTDLWFCMSDGTAWWYLAMTKAT